MAHRAAATSENAGSSVATRVMSGSAAMSTGMMASRGRLAVPIPTNLDCFAPARYRCAWKLRSPQSASPRSSDATLPHRRHPVLSLVDDNVLVLYFLDTMLSFGVIFAGLAKSFSPAKPDTAVTWVKAEFAYVYVALLLCALFAIPLGMPVGLALGAGGVTFGGALADPRCVLACFGNAQRRSGRTSGFTALWKRTRHRNCG